MLVVSIKVWRLVTREGIRVRIKRIKKGGGGWVVEFHNQLIKKEEGCLVFVRSRALLVPCRSVLVWGRSCSWSIPGLNLSDFPVIGPYLDRLVFYRERDASIGCLWSRMQDWT